MIGKDNNINLNDDRMNPEGPENSDFSQVIVGRLKEIVYPINF